jgi:predicted nucleic acid-binding protein
MPYLVDTDILVDLLRSNEGAADYVDSLGDWSLALVSAMELLAGAKGNQQVREINILVATYGAVPLNSEVGQLAYNLMSTYASSHGLDPADALIAATAIHDGRKLATRNRKHFEAIGGLDIETPTY